MRIKEGFELRNLLGEYIIVATGRKNIDFCKVINLNESAALIWNAVLDKDFTSEDMAQVLMDAYEVEAEVALSDSKKMADEWIQMGLVEA